MGLFLFRRGKAGRADTVSNFLAADPPPLTITEEDGELVGRPTEALHYSGGKSGVDQIPPELLLEWGDVFLYGERKYARDNWKLGTDWHQFYGSALRHLFRFWSGEDIDPESGLSHLAHALWNVGCLRYYQRRALGQDDRDRWAPPTSETADMGPDQMLAAIEEALGPGVPLADILPEPAPVEEPVVLNECFCDMAPDAHDPHLQMWVDPAPKGGGLAGMYTYVITATGEELFI